MSLTVINKAKSRVTINYLQETKHEDAASEPKTVPLELVDHDPATGERGKRIVERTVPASVSWLPGETLSGLPDGLRDIEEFQTAVAAGRLKVTAG